MTHDYYSQNLITYKIFFSFVSFLVLDHTLRYSDHFLKTHLTGGMFFSMDRLNAAI